MNSNSSRADFTAFSVDPETVTLGGFCWYLLMGSIRYPKRSPFTVTNVPNRFLKWYSFRFSLSLKASLSLFHLPIIFPTCNRCCCFVDLRSKSEHCASHGSPWRSRPEKKNLDGVLASQVELPSELRMIVFLRLFLNFFGWGHQNDIKIIETTLIIMMTLKKQTLNVSQ